MRPVLLGDLQCRQAVEGRKGIVCENQVKAALFEGRNEINLSLNTRNLAPDTVVRERFLNKFCIPEVIFKIQNTQWRFHFQVSVPSRI